MEQQTVSVAQAPAEARPGWFSRLRPHVMGMALLTALGGLTLLAGVAQRGSRTSAPGVVAQLTPQIPPVAPTPALVAPPPAHWSHTDGSAVSFAATLDRSAVLRGGDGFVRVELVMKADADAAKSSQGSDVVVVLDRSGSMNGPRLSQARGAVQALIGQLLPQDRLALVAFDDSAEVAIPLESASEAAKARWRRVTADIHAGSGTNISAAVDKSVALLEGMSEHAKRVILLSDGEANSGDASADGLRARARRAAQNGGVLSTIGIGEGFNEFLMTQMADAGTGNFHYLADASKLEAIVERELASGRTTVASALHVELTPPAGVKVLDVAGYPLETSSGVTSFRVGSLSAGQERRVWVNLQVPVQQAGQLNLGPMRLAYREGNVSKNVAAGEALSVNCVAEPAAAMAAIDKVAWERGTVQEEWGRTQRDVAQAVKEGKREEARGLLRRFRQDQGALNATLQSQAVAASLKESEAVEQQVDDAFSGADQGYKQNVFSKGNLARSFNSRRGGSDSGWLSRGF